MSDQRVYVLLLYQLPVIRTGWNPVETPVKDYPRQPAGFVLLLILAIGATLAILDDRLLALSAGDAAMSELQQAIGQPDVPPGTWLKYARKLEQASRFDHAAAAYRKVLESEPFNRQARLSAATCLARAGKSAELLAFVDECVRMDPKLSLDIFDRPEVQPYMSDPRLAALAKEAQVQSMD